MLGALCVQCHLYQSRQTVTQSGGQFVSVEHGYLPFYPAFVRQALDASQAGGGRNVELLGQRHIANVSVVLQGVEQAEVGFV